jgi:RNase H-fold protein (predicted Holliday junction resolvase)
MESTRVVAVDSGAVRIGVLVTQPDAITSSNPIKTVIRIVPPVVRPAAL